MLIILYLTTWALLVKPKRVCRESLLYFIVSYSKRLCCRAKWTLKVWNIWTDYCFRQFVDLVAKLSPRRELGGCVMGTIKLSCGNDVWQLRSLCIQKYTHFLLQRQSFEGSRVGCMELNPSFLVSFSFCYHYGYYYRCWLRQCFRDIVDSISVRRDRKKKKPLKSIFIITNLEGWGNRVVKIGETRLSLSGSV